MIFASPVTGTRGTAEYNGDSEMFLVEFLSNTLINAILIALGLLVLAGRF